MQQLYHVAQGADRAVLADPSDLTRLRDAGGWVWLDVVGVDHAEVQAIGDEFGFDNLAVEKVLARSEYPTVEDYPDHLFAALMGVSEDEHRLRTVEYDAFVGPGYLVTFAHEDLPGFRWMRDRFEEAGRLAGVGPDRFFALLVEAGAARFRTLVDSLEDQVDGLEGAALAGDESVLGEIHALRRDSLLLRRVLGPQADAVHRLAVDELPGLTERARMRFAGIESGFDRAVETTESARGLLGAVLETYRASVAEKANDVMKVLTVFAAIVLPLSLIAGIYGMNFVHMPELAWPWAYGAVLGLMGALGIGLWLYFAKRGFIGRPRLGAVPRTIGRGLAGVVRLTTKPVAGVARVLGGRQAPHRETDDTES